jgi:putative CocE/NonD family hydrolase
MRDGRLLSARLWMPENAGPVPAILEYVPYRKRDFLRSRDEPIHAYFAQHGYVSVRLDLAGSGDSEGVLVDEYALQEQEDALDAIAWLSEQPWCSGSVGMIGKSWGGFNCLQVAARQPPALRAIVPVCATDDRYGDDVHFMGGCLLVDGIDWGAVLQTFLPRPPDTVILGDKWRDIWSQRLDHVVCPLEEWLKHLSRDEFWQHGSICEDYSKIKVATLLVGGWVDSYKRALLRMAARLPGPTKCIMGPWAHLYPHDGSPGPAIGFLQEAVRWYDYWLKNIENGVMEEPKLRAYIQDSEPPQTHYEVRKGRWVGENEWPSSTIQERAWYLSAGGLHEQAEPLPEKELPYNLAVGQFGGDGGAVAMPSELAPDQRYDDALSLCFDSEPLSEPLEILGAPLLHLQLCADKPNAMIAARLNDIRPDGSVAKITTGLLNLTHRGGSAQPELLEAGKWYDVVVDLLDIGYRLPAGHRLRVALSPSYWPFAWPSPEPVKIRVRGPSRISLPERKPLAEPAVAFLPPESAPGPTITCIRPGRDFQRLAIFDLAHNTVTRRLIGSGGAYGGEGMYLLHDIGLGMEYRGEREQTIELGNPESAVTEHKQRITFQRPGWEAVVETRVRLGSTQSEFVLNCDVDVYDNDVRLLTRSWNRRIPRQNV